jgi:hypothetical protein
MVLVLLLEPEASAQVAAGQPARMVPMPAEMAVQATFDTSYLLALYMAQLAAAGSAPSQADIDEATRQYFTNGAAATGVPISGPGAAYFTNGAAVTGVPTSGPGAAYFTNGAEVMAYSPSSVTSAPEATGVNVALVASERYEQDAGLEGAVPNPSDVVATGPAVTRPAPPSEVRAEPTATGLTCSPMEIEAAIAIGREFATAAASPASAAACTAPVSTSVPSRDETALTFAAAEPESNSPICPVAPAFSSSRRPSLLSRIALALSGAFLGGLAVALWLRPRPIRVAQGR